MNIDEIKRNAPEGAQYWRDMDSVCSPNEILYYCCAFGVWLVFNDEKDIWEQSIIYPDGEYILEQLKPL